MLRLKKRTYNTVYNFLIPTADKPTAWQELIHLLLQNQALCLQKLAR